MKARNRFPARKKLPWLACCLILVGASAVWADGTEELNDLTDTVGPLPEGATGMVGNGASLHGQTNAEAEAVFDFTLPPGATVLQMFLYWNGFDSEGSDGDDMVTLTINGGDSTNVSGTEIATPTLFFAGHVSYTYRADISDRVLDLVAGQNDFTVTDVEGFGSLEMGGNRIFGNGASILAIIQEPGQAVDLQIFDGQDLAYDNSPFSDAGFPPPLDTTEVVTFDFTPTTSPREADLTLLAGSVAGQGSDPGVECGVEGQPDCPPRPNTVQVTVDGCPPVDILNPFQSLDGFEWDHIGPGVPTDVVQVITCGQTELVCFPTNECGRISLEIPAGSSSVQVQAISEPPQGQLPGGQLDPETDKPASMAWLVAGLSIPEGCPAVTLFKEVSCDGGTTWSTECIGWDGEPEVLVRYAAEQTSGALASCTLADSNTGILPAPVPVLPPFDGSVIHTTEPIECSETLEMNEPDTGSLLCECGDLGSADTVTAISNEANIECQFADLEVSKECFPQDPETGEHDVTVTVTNPDNPRGATLRDCVVSDPQAGFESEPFELAPGDSMDFQFSLQPTEQAVAIESLSVTDLTSGLTAEDLVSSLLGESIAVSNVVFAGTDVSAGQFTGGVGPIGFDLGVILGSGAITNILGPNSQDSAGSALGIAGDPDLDSLIPGFTTTDATVLEFDFVPDDPFLTFQYVFASEEYNEFVCGAFNDVFGFFVNGVNMALLPDNVTVVSINNVNAGNSERDNGTSFCSEGFPYDPRNPNFYRDNDLDNPGGATIDIEADGLTVVLTLTSPVNPGVTNHLKLAVADAGDSILDSWVMIPAGSVISVPEICDGIDNDGDGMTDEDLGTTTCGVGACENTVDNCVDGVTQACVPGDPVPEVCGNGIDDDCDGLDDADDPDCDVVLVNEVSVTCEIDDSGKDITRTAEDECEPRECELTLEKQVSCDGGASWSESCIGWDTPENPEVKVRYLATTTATSNAELVNCVLTDSNGEILPAPVDLGTLPGNLSGEVIHMTDLLNCGEELELGEPDTASLSCECFAEGSGFFRTAEDQADIECQEPELEVQKDCSTCDPATGKNTVDIRVSNPDNPRGASLADCVATDPTLDFTSAPFDLAPGDSMQFSLEVGPLGQSQDNQVSVTCNIVGGDKTISASAQATCEPCTCELELQKEVSCDGGLTWGDSCLGGDTPDDPEVMVRYLASTQVAGTGLVGEFVNCVLTDTNPAILPAPVPIGTLTGNLSDEPIFTTGLLECTEDLELGEPNTATLSCECYEDGSDILRQDQDQADIECQEPALEVQKDCSTCDPATGKNTVDIRVSNPDNPRGASLADCVATDPTLDFTSAPFGLAPGDSMQFSLEVGPLDGQSQDNQVSVTCNIVGADKPISASDSATCEPCTCDLELQKEVSCDGGLTWGDSCLGWDTPEDPEIMVRYLASTQVTDTGLVGEFVNCVLTDTNSAILAAPVPIGTLPGNLSGEPIFTTGLLECTAGLELGEPNTATLSCECYEDGSDILRQDQDQADIECQEPTLDVFKDCANQDPSTGISDISITVSNPENPRGASLTRCEVIDELAGFTSEPFDLAPGESRTFDLTVSGLEERTLNIAWVHCDIVGSNGKRITVDALDLCRVCTEITLDKQVSCDGGDTYVDVGPDDNAAETCVGRQGGEAEVTVRFVANGLVDGLHSWCELVDSNGAIVAAPQPMFGFPGAVFETPLMDCSEDLAAGEPDTATLTCICFEGVEGYTISASDEANIECATPECGDGTVDSDETCDPPGEPAGASGNICREDCTVCGDGIVNAMETCDDGNNDDDGCRNNCTFCGDNVEDPGEECDDGNNEDGDGCSATCTFERECILGVVKTCFVPGDGDDDDDDDDDCDGRVVSMKLQYTGEGCDATNNDQSGQVSCFGGAAGADPVSILVTDRRGTEVYADEGTVFLGDVVDASALNAVQRTGGDPRIRPNTLVTIDDGSESVMFHTSCSKPLAVGDQFGSMLLVELTTTKGGTATLPAVAASPTTGMNSDTSECTVPPPPAPPHCDRKIQSVGFRLIGGDCSQPTQDQGGALDCSGAVNLALVPIVGVTCYSNGVVFFNSDDANLTLGDIFEVSAANAGETQLPSEIICDLTDGFDNVLQSLTIHTSCSKPLNLGDILGALEVFSLDTSGGGEVSLATEVFYSYKITNNSEVAAVGVTAVDSELGEVPGSPIDSIPADGGMVMLEASALIRKTTTNTVTVNGSLETGEICEAVEATATVTVEEPPSLQECTSKIDAMLLQYIGPDIAGLVTVEFRPRTQDADVTYQFDDGLVSGTIVSSDAQNGFSVDPGVQGQGDAGSKTSVSINGEEEVIHTSCSTPFIAGLPAPLNDPKGDPSPNWFVVSFTQK